MGLVKSIRRIFKPQEELTTDLSKEYAIHSSKSYFGILGTSGYSDLLKKIGKDRTLYETMHQDDKLRGTHEFKTKAVMSVDWEIKPASESSNDKTIAERFKSEISNLEIPFVDAMKNLFDAWYYSFKVAEIVLLAEGGKWILKNIKNKKTTWFELITDEFDNLKGLKLKNQFSQDIMSPEKFIIYTNPYIKDGNWYGESDYDAVYREWWSKDIITKFRNIALQSYGMPIRKVLYDIDKMTSSKQDDMRTKVDNLHDNYVLYIPAKRNPANPAELLPIFDLSFLESGRRTTEEFNATIEQLNTAMSRRLLIGDKLGFTDSEGGSFALGKVHLNIFIMVISEIHRRLEDIINKQLIERWTKWNYGDRAIPPKLKFFDLAEGITKEKVEIVKIAIDAGIINHKELWVREYLKFPELEEGIELPEPAPKGVGGFGGFKTYATKYERKVNFKQIEKDLDDDEILVVEKLVKTFEKIKEDIITKATRLAESGLVKNVEIKIKSDLLSEVEDKLALFFMRTYQYGRKEARQEISIAKKLKEEKEIPLLSINGEWEGYANKYALTEKERDRFNRQKMRAFYITGLESNKITKNVERILIDNIGKKSVKEITIAIEDILSPYLETAKINERVEEAYRLNTIVRTNATRIFNESRLDAFEDPELQNFVQAYQYSAVLDDRTTDFCWEHGTNGDIVRAGDPRLYRYPPAHFNCRSMWIPIFQGEDFSVSWKERGVKPAEGFE